MIAEVLENISRLEKDVYELGLDAIDGCRELPLPKTLSTIILQALTRNRHSWHEQFVEGSFIHKLEKKHEQVCLF